MVVSYWYEIWWRLMVTSLAICVVDIFPDSKSVRSCCQVSQYASLLVKAFSPIYEIKWRSVWFCIAMVYVFWKNNYFLYMSKWKEPQLEVPIYYLFLSISRCVDAKLASKSRELSFGLLFVFVKDFLIINKRLWVVLRWT